MGQKVAAVKFLHTDKALIKGKVGHSRTGACTCRHDQRCQHGMRPNVGLKGRRTSGKKSKIGGR